MTPQLEEANRLLRLAERDYAVFGLLVEGGDIAHAATGFHAQQAVEKTIKALLCLHDIDFPRTHDLENLSSRLADRSPLPKITIEQLRSLTPYAVDFRYDDEVEPLMAVDEMQSVLESLLRFVHEQIDAARGAPR